MKTFRVLLILAFSLALLPAPAAAAPAAAVVVPNPELPPGFVLPPECALSAEGVTVLINSSVAVRRGEASVTLVGVDDAYSRRADLEAAFADADPDGFCILLSHCPSLAPGGIARGAWLRRRTRCCRSLRRWRRLRRR